MDGPLAPAIAQQGPGLLQRGLLLLDLLEHLPVAMLRVNFWPYLPKDARNSCREACSRLKELSNQLQCGFTVDFSGRDVSPAELQRHCAVLRRHEHLEVLTLTGPTSELLNATCLREGGAGCRRVRKVVLAHGPLLAATTGDALALACPILRTLRIQFYSDVSPTFFRALGGLEHLTEVVLTKTRLSPAAVDALAALVSLCKLYIHTDEGPPLTPEAMPRLVSLTGLRELHISSHHHYTADCILQFAVATALTRLTSLELSVEKEWREHRDPECEAAMNSVFAQLGVC